MASGSAFSNVLKAKEDLQKSPEQLEQEKRSVIAQRVPQLQLDGKTKEDLIEKVLVILIDFEMIRKTMICYDRLNNCIVFFINYMAISMN